jgi:phage terminase large subunit
VKRLFVDRCFHQNEDPLEYRFVSAMVYDNEVLLKSDPSYVEQLKALPQRLRDAWLYGKWDVFEGQFFSEFDESKHVIEADAIPKNTKRYLAFDYGLDMLAVLLLAKDGEDNLYVERELCCQNLTLGEAAERIADFASGLRVEYAVASPDLWNRRQDSGKSGYEIMRSIRGMPPMIAADDRRIPGWRVLKEYLSQREGKPNLYICASCSNLIHSMQSLLCDKSRVEDASSEPHSITHTPEALRYGVMSRMADPCSSDESLPFSFSKPQSTLQNYFGE